MVSASRMLKKHQSRSAARASTIFRDACAIDRPSMLRDSRKMTLPLGRSAQAGRRSFGWVAQVAQAVIYAR